ncbi:unnamed protein product [Urochloa humidicola]
MECGNAVRRDTSHWADLPPDLLMKIFSRIPSWSEVSQVCISWRHAIPSPPRPVVLCPVSDCPPPDPLKPVAMQLLIPTVAVPRGSIVSQSINEAKGPIFRYLTLPIADIGSEMRCIDSSGGFPLFVDDRYSRLVLLPHSNSQQPRCVALELPAGVHSQDIYIGGIAVSVSSSDAHCLPHGISVIVVATSTCLFGMRAAGQHRSWSVLEVKEPAEGHNFEQQGVRTFVSIHFDGRESAYMLDASRRLCIISWNAAGALQMLELPILGGANALLTGGIQDFKMVWLLKIPLRDQHGSNLVCLVYYRLESFGIGRFEAFDLVEEEANRLWITRLNILGDLCVMVAWGPGAAAIVYNKPKMIGLCKGRIYSSHSGLRSYILGWSYSEVITVPSCWPFPLWIYPEFPDPFFLRDALLNIVEDSVGVEEIAAADAGEYKESAADAGEDKESAEKGEEPATDADQEDEKPAANAIAKVELSLSAPALDAAATEGVAMARAATPAPLLERLLRRTLLQLSACLD